MTDSELVAAWAEIHDGTPPRPKRHAAGACTHRLVMVQES